MTGRRRRHTPVPVAQERAHLISESGQLGQSAIERVQAMADERTDAVARWLTGVPVAEDRSQLLEREADRERALNQFDAIDGAWRVAAVPAGSPLDAAQQPEALVMTEAVRTHSGCGRKRPGAHPLACHGRFATLVESPVRCSSIW